MRSLLLLALLGVVCAAFVSAQDFEDTLEKKDDEVEEPMEEADELAVDKRGKYSLLFKAMKKVGKHILKKGAQRGGRELLGKEEKRCWLRSYGRGVGKVLSTCKSSQQKNGLLCYPKCKSGYGGAGPVCWSYCPHGFHDDGAFCRKPSPYGRGAGYAIWHGGKCKRKHRRYGCSKYGLIWYPNCKPGFHNVGCCICSPNCINGMHDIGVSCAKKTYGRGAGHPMGCKKHEQQSGLLCYPPCKHGYKGIGPVCWGKCPPGWKQCGALCQQKSSCTKYLLKFIKPVAKAAASIASENPVGVAMATVDVVSNLIFPVCNH